MKIILAPDSFKGTFTSIELIEKLEKGATKYFPSANIVKIPIADGGEGTVEALRRAIGGDVHERTVTGPLGDKIVAKFAMKDQIAIIEMAEASGITLVAENKRNPLETTSYGTGELVLEAIGLGAKEIILGIGGSATNDGGIGMLQAIGVKLLDESGNAIGFGGKYLSRISEINTDDMDPRIKGIRLTVMCDVTNPLTGPTGATFTYGPQKGADREQLNQLEQGMLHYESMLNTIYPIAMSEIPGTGAAGGIGAALVVFLSGRLQPGIETILDLVSFDLEVADADLVITGEGRIDGQSVNGKVPVGIGKRCINKTAKVIALAGSLGEQADLVYEHGIDAIFTSIDRPMSLSEIMENASSIMDDSIDRMFRILQVGIQLSAPRK